MKSLFYRLIIFLDTASEADTNYNIAWYMAHNFSKVAKMGISQLAKECYVSPATISYYSDQVCDAISKLSQRLDWNVIDKVLQAIHDSDSVAFFGTQFSHSAALHFQTDLLMLEKFTMAYMETERQIDCARLMDENSVAIIVTVNGFYARSNSKVLQYLKKSKCKVVLMTNNPGIDIGINVNYTIVLGDSEQRKIGKHTLLTAVELMSLRYYSLYYPGIQEKII